MKTINRQPSKIEFVSSNNKKKENSNKNTFTSSFNNDDSNKKLRKNSDSTQKNNTRFIYTEKSNLRITNNFNNSGNINVVLRCRPQNEKEKKISSEISINFIDKKTVSINSTLEKNNYKFTFDRSFDTETKQVDIFDFVAKPILNSVLDGFNGTIFAYGQTSSGKTFTMQGYLDNPELEGITPRIIKSIFEHISNSSEENQYIVKISLLEIYNEKIKDLIEPSKSNLQVREDKKRGIYIEDLSEHTAANSREVLSIMKKGMDNRAVNATNMNAESSRSHSLVVFNIIHNNLKDLSTKISKLYLVDLAGSEKTSKTGATGQTLEEAKSINKSLTTLGLVINNLTESKKTHIPYRESKLTRILQESLGGNAKTCLIITCSPSRYNEAETLSTLRFGIRAKKVKNNAKINKDFSIAELKLQIEKLENEITKYRGRMNILENIMEDNGLMIPSINESFCLDGLKNLLAQKTKEFKEFAIESNNSLINGYETNDELSHKNKYIQEFLVENQKGELEESKEYKKNLNDFDDEIKKENSYLQVSDDDENNDNEHKENNISETLFEREKEEIKRISEDDSENKSDSFSVNYEKEEIETNVENINNNDENKSKIIERLNKTENNPNNITSGNSKYLELIEMFTKLDQKKSHIEEDLNYAIERIKEFKMDENRKNNLINDILKMKQKSTQKIYNLEGEINDVINKTIIQNNNDSILLNDNYNKNNNKFTIEKDALNAANNDVEILADLKKESNNNNLIIESNNIINTNQITIEKDTNMHITSINKNDLIICEENIINLNYEKKDKLFEIGKDEIIILKENKHSSINLTKNFRNSIERSKEISFEINNSSQNNIIHEINNYSNSKLKDNYNNSIELGLSINFNCKSNNREFFNNGKIIKKVGNEENNKKIISFSKIDEDYEKLENSKTNSKKEPDRNSINKDINLDIIRTTNYSAGESVNIRNIIKENHFNNQENDIDLNSNQNNYVENDNKLQKELQNDNPETDAILRSNNTNIDNSCKKIINLESKDTNLNGLTNVLASMVKNNEQETPKLKTNFLKKYSNIGNKNNFIFNGSTPIINSANNSRNPSNIVTNKIDNSEKHNKNFDNQSAPHTNEKEFSLSKIKLNTPINYEDDFISSTYPQTNNLLVNEFASSSIDDDKNKVIEDLFFKLKEYSNKIPELNNLIDTYKDKLNVKNPDQNANLANILNHHFNNHLDFANNVNDNKILGNDNKNKDVIKKNSIQNELNQINIKDWNKDTKNNICTNKSLTSEKNESLRRGSNANSYSDKNVNVSKDSKKTEEIISNLELKAERLFENYFKKDKFDIKGLINDTPKNHHIDLKKYKNIKDYKI